MSHKSKEYSILYGCNDGYAPYAGISICSLLENNKDATRINIYLMSDGISERNKRLLSEQVAKYGANRNIIIFECESIIREFKEIGIPSYRGSYAAYLRLAFEKVVPEYTDRLIYLDCDTLVVGSLDELWSLDLGGNLLAVVAESLGDPIKSQISFDEEDVYFNSGMLLINVSEWKRQNCSGQIYDMMKNPLIKNPTGSDQDYLNYLAKDKKIVVSPKYNLQPIHIAYSWKAYRRNYSTRFYYSKECINESINNPVILHTYRFLGRFPWNKNSLHPSKEIFNKYKNVSCWSEKEEEIKRIPLYIKIERILYRVLPGEWFLRMFMITQRVVVKRTRMNR